jgi:hypothetical protein
MKAKRVPWTPERRAKTCASCKAVCADPAVRAKMSAASKASYARRNPEIAALSAEQRDTYQLYRRKGFTRDEALAAAQGAGRVAA